MQGTNTRMKHVKFKGTQKLTSRGGNEDMVFKRNTFVTKKLICKLLLTDSKKLYSTLHEMKYLFILKYHHPKTYSPKI